MSPRPKAPAVGGLELAEKSSPKRLATIHGKKAPDAPQANAKISPTVGRWNFSSGIKIFHLSSAVPPPLTATGLVPMPADYPVPGYVCQAARALLNVSQAWLWQRAGVSKKTINDYENGFSSPKSALILRIRRALEEIGAQFVHGSDVVGVVVYTSSEATVGRSRSDKLRGS